MKLFQHGYGDGTVGLFGDGEGDGYFYQEPAETPSTAPYNDQLGAGDYIFPGLLTLPLDLRCRIIQARISMNQSLRS